VPGISKTGVSASLAGALGLVLFTAGAGDAYAAPNPPPPLAETLSGDALRDYQTARALLLYHDEVGALVRFTRVYDAVHDPRLLANMGLCEKGMGHPAYAADFFERALRDGAALFPPEQAGQLRAMLAEADAAAGKVRVSVDVPGAAVLVDDRAIGPSPLAAAVRVDRGTHRVRVAKAGYREWVRDVSVEGANEAAVDVSLEADVPAGTVRVTTSPDNDVTIDGRVVSKGSSSTRVAAGTHALRVTGPGKLDYRSDVSVREGETRTVDVSLRDDKRTPIWLWGVAGAVVVVGVILAGAAVFHSSSSHETAGSMASPLRVSW
jgi:hypothetical protein